jgi:hypothetical protein
MVQKKGTQAHKPETKRTKPTQILIKFDAGFPNNLTIRGSGAGLSWTRGLPLKNIKSNEWYFELTEPFNLIEFKILINDKTYESGDNHILSYGESISYTPNF